MDIKVWVQCFASYVKIVAVNEPERVADLLGYMISIIKASQDFAGSAWVTYDDMFRRQAANDKENICSNINTSLFSLCFTSNARTSSRCEFFFTSDQVNGPIDAPSRGGRCVVTAAKFQSGLPRHKQHMAYML